MVLGAAQIEFTPALTSEDTGNIKLPLSLHENQHTFLAKVNELLSDCFATMRGNVQDIFPSGWELAPFQSLAGVDPDLMLQREQDFFVCVDGAVYSKDFAVKAQAMKTVPLGTPLVSSSVPLTLTGIF